MKLKDLFTVPEGKPITEKVFYRVLVCTICSMILSMSCLVGTTWALFSVTIDNGVNQISISEVNVSVTKEIQSDDGTLESGIYIVPHGATLEPGDYNVKISYNVQPDSLKQLSKAYVIFRLGEKELGYVILGEAPQDDTTAEKNLKITADTEGELYYKITWDFSQIPEGMPNLDNLKPGGASDTQPTETTESTEATESTTESTEPETTGSTESTGSTETTGSTESSESTENTGSSESTGTTETETTGSTESTGSGDSEQ